MELNTKICRDVAEADQDLTTKIRVVGDIARSHGLRFFWSGTHPFSLWQDQEVTPDERYFDLINGLQETARRLLTFGLHVHVGVDSGDKAIMVCDRIMQHLPTLLALSVNSPFWQGRNTGLHSQRSKVMETLPTAGLPPLMRNWSEYAWLLNHMVETGFIKTIREIWWDVRPHHNFGTVEVRICDMPPSLEHVLGLTALIQCLVHDLSQEIDSGNLSNSGKLPPVPDQARTNGGPAAMAWMPGWSTPPAHQAVPARQVVQSLLDRLQPRAEELGCTPYLEIVREMAEQPTGSVRQLQIYEETNDLAEVVRRMLARSEPMTGG